MARFRSQLLRISERIYRSRQDNGVKNGILSFFLDFVYLTIILALTATLILFIYNGFLPFSTFIIVVNFFAMALTDVNSIRDKVRNILTSKFLFIRFKEDSKRGDRKTKSRVLKPLRNLTISNLSLSFGEELSIFTNLTLKINRGGKYLLTAPSGSGKSSLTYIITGLLSSYTGKILWNKLSYKEIPSNSLRERIYLLSNKSQIFKATVSDNITLFNKDIPRERILNLLQLVGLEDIRPEDEIATNLISKGQAQKVALARAILADRELLILDEALSAIDLKGRARIEAYLLANPDLTLINLTHQLLDNKGYDLVLDLREAMGDNGV